MSQNSLTSSYQEMSSRFNQLSIINGIKQTKGENDCSFHFTLSFFFLCKVTFGKMYNLKPFSIFNQELPPWQIYSNYANEVESCYQPVKWFKHKDKLLAFHTGWVTKWHSSFVWSRNLIDALYSGFWSQFGDIKFPFRSNIFSVPKDGVERSTSFQYRNWDFIDHQFRISNWMFD